MSQPTVLLTVDQVSERLQVSAETLKSWRWRRFGPPFLRMGGRIRYTETDLEAWIEQQRGSVA